MSKAQVIYEVECEYKVSDGSRHVSSMLYSNDEPAVYDYNEYAVENIQGFDRIKLTCNVQPRTFESQGKTFTLHCVCIQTRLLHS